MFVYSANDVTGDMSYRTCLLTL